MQQQQPHVPDLRAVLQDTVHQHFQNLQNQIMQDAQGYQVALNIRNDTERSELQWQVSQLSTELTQAREELRDLTKLRGIIDSLNSFSEQLKSGEIINVDEVANNAIQEVNADENGADAPEGDEVFEISRTDAKSMKRKAKVVASSLRSLKKQMPKKSRYMEQLETVCAQQRLLVQQIQAIGGGGEA
jgi:predicted RecA/RadA family phage recombinase